VTSAETSRRIARAARQDAVFALQLRLLPLRVAAVQLRARVRARRLGDAFSLTSATTPNKLGVLLRLARGRRYVVELGTGTAWATIALVVADPRREVTSFDVVVQPERLQYLALLGPDDRSRIELIDAPGATGPRSQRPVELLYVDSSHDREQTAAEFRAWAPVLDPGALVVFDDYDHPDYPGVREAIEELGLTGEQRDFLFVHRHERADSG
jgi:predicted O-methyltransferase YrrM